MLVYLKVNNLALMAEAELNFEPGFTVFTGETGAGKSVLLGALSLLAGARADKTIIKKDTDACTVEALFCFKNTQKIDAFLEAKGLPVCEEGRLILKRSLSQEKGSRVFINSSVSNVASLLQLGSLWVDFHGPGEHQKLVDEAYQLEILDAFLKDASVKKNYQDLYSTYKKLLKEKKDIQSQHVLDEDERIFLQSQLDKLKSINITKENINELEGNFNKYSKSQEIGTVCEQLIYLLGGNNGVLSGLHNVLKKNIDLQRLGLDEALVLKERIESALIEVEDIKGEYQMLQSSIDIDPNAMLAIEKQMQVWLEIKRKYGPDIESILGKIKKLELKLSSQASVEEALYHLESQIEKVYQDLEKAAYNLKIVRLNLAQDLRKQAEKLLENLGFKSPKLEFSIIDETEFQAHGKSKLSIQFCPNVGSELLPLSKIASSGEMARVILALKVLMAKVEGTPLLVFDEVDANIGGEIGAQVGKQLAYLGKNHQVFCITHLPQVAALGQYHWLVRKVNLTTDTSVYIENLDRDDQKRKQELARMLGDRNSSIALQHAHELLMT